MSFYGGKYETIEELEKAHKEAESTMHTDKTKLKELAEELGDNSGFIQQLVESLEAVGIGIDEETLELVSLGDDEGNEGNEGEGEGEGDGGGNEGDNEPITMSQLKKILPELLEPAMEPLAKAQIGGMVDSVLTQYFQQNPKARENRSAMRRTLITLANEGDDITDESLVEDIAEMAEFRSRRTKDREGDGEEGHRKEGEGEGEGEGDLTPKAPVIDFAGVSGGGKSVRTEPSLSSDAKVQAKKMGVPEDKFLENQKAIEKHDGTNVEEGAENG